MIIRITTLCFLLVFTTLWAIGAVAAETNEKPLVVLRFNSNFVSYEQQLAKAVNMAMEASPEVAFNLVAVSPQTFDKVKNKEFEQEAQMLVKKINGQIQQYGVKKDKITSNFEKDKLVNSNEIRIFVQ